MEHYFTNNEQLKSELRNIYFKYKDVNLTFKSDNGVFSKNKIDYGSKVLVETILERETKRETILDVGCGYGFMGITISKVWNSKVTLIDINKRAVHLTTLNIKENKVDGESLVSDMYENITNKYDLIITNPPIRAGKETVLNILMNAKNYLNKNGKLWYVIRKDQGAKSINEVLKSIYNVEIVKKDKGFYIMSAENIDNEN